MVRKNNSAHNRAKGTGSIFRMWFGKVHHPDESKYAADKEPQIANRRATAANRNLGDTDSGFIAFSRADARRTAALLTASTLRRNPGDFHLVSANRRSRHSSLHLWSMICICSHQPPNPGNRGFDRNLLIQKRSRPHSSTAMLPSWPGNCWGIRWYDATRPLHASAVTVPGTNASCSSGAWLRQKPTLDKSIPPPTPMPARRRAMPCCLARRSSLCVFHLRQLLLHERFVHA